MKLSNSIKLIKSSKVIMLCFILLALTYNCVIINAKSVSYRYISGQRYPVLDLSANNITCDEEFFESINIKVNNEQDNYIRGDICGGHCCSKSTEEDLRQRSAVNFERLIRHHTKNLRGVLESTSTSFRDHVLELSLQSEQKTLNVFSQVYRRMFPSSKHLINDLYTNIRNYLNSSVDYQLDDSVQIFFKNLFPIAYHQAVHLKNDGDNDGDLHDDYIKCLKHTFNELTPFGDIPKELSKNLVQSVLSAQVFINALKEGSEVLDSTDGMDSIYLTDTCKIHLLKMKYCRKCNGLNKQSAKPCYGYCLNVMRGCLAEYVSVLDNSWSNFAEAITLLVTKSIQSNIGIVSIIKGLDAKLSEAIMRVMENGPELEKKVKKTCGSPKLLSIHHKQTNENRTTQLTTIKWATPPDAELLLFLLTIEKSKEFYSKIVDNVCEDEDYKRSDTNCWSGESVGDYTKTVMSTVSDAQKYNPEVPMEHSFARVAKLNELVDKLIKLKSKVMNTLPSYSTMYSDIQDDMAGHDELEGSGRFGHVDDLDDEEFNNVHGSGDGSGDGPTVTSRTISELDTASMPGKGVVSYAPRIESTNLLNSLVFTLLFASYLLH